MQEVLACFATCTERVRPTGIGKRICKRGYIQHVPVSGFGISKAWDTFPPGSHSSVSGRKSDILRSKSANPSGHGSLVLDDEVPNVLQIARGEDKSDVSLDVGKMFERI